MAQPKNVKGRTFSWSFSAWEGFGLCPRQYAAKSFYYEVKFQETVHTQWGNRVHKAAELFLQSKQNGDEEALKVVEPYATAMLRAGLRVEAELEISFSRDFKVVPWFSDECWLRVKIDVVLMNFARTEAKLYDWKTGKLKEGDDHG